MCVALQSEAEAFYLVPPCPTKGRRGWWGDDTERRVWNTALSYIWCVWMQDLAGAVDNHYTRKKTEIALRFI
jgi:hypothetical protein